MRSSIPLAVSLVSVLMAAPTAMPAWAQAAHVDANGMPTDHSTPAEQAQTAALNRQIQADNRAADAQAAQQQAQSAAADAQYRQQQQHYQDQLRQNQAAQQDFQDRTAAYESLRARYAAERAAYRRQVWPERYRDGRLADDARLIGSRVEIVSGDRVGTVASVARAPGGGIEALYVTLDNGKQVWIDEADTRFDRAADLVLTDLDRTDLHAMADERL